MTSEYPASEPNELGDTTDDYGDFGTEYTAEELGYDAVLDNANAIEEDDDDARLPEAILDVGGNDVVNTTAERASNIYDLLVEQHEEWPGYVDAMPDAHGATPTLCAETSDSSGKISLHITPDRTYVDRATPDGIRNGTTYYKDEDGQVRRAEFSRAAALAGLPPEGSIRFDDQATLTGHCLEEEMIRLVRFEYEMGYEHALATPEELAQLAVWADRAVPETVSMQDLVDIFGQRLTAKAESPGNYPTREDSIDAYEIFDPAIRTYLLENGIDVERLRPSQSPINRVEVWDGNASLQIDIGMMNVDTHDELSLAIRRKLDVSVDEIYADHPQLAVAPGAARRGTMTRYTELQYRNHMDGLAVVRRSFVANRLGLMLTQDVPQQARCDRLEALRIRNFLRSPSPY